MMEKLVVELRGKLDVDATSGTAHYAFEQIHHELSAIRRIRAARTVSRDLGDVILDSGT